MTSKTKSESRKVVAKTKGTKGAEASAGIVKKGNVVRLRGPVDAEVLSVRLEDRDDELDQFIVQVEFKAPGNELTANVFPAANQIYDEE